MKQVIALKLTPSPEQFQALLETVETFNRACQYAAEIASHLSIFNKLALQPHVYGELRTRFGLSAQMAIRAIAKAVETCKRHPGEPFTFHPHGAMVYDERILTFKGTSSVLIRALAGRILVPLQYGEYQATRLKYIRGQADLMLRDNVFYLYACIEISPAPPADKSDGILGVDLGIVTIAKDSMGNSYSGEKVKSVRRRMRRLRASLQKKGTRSARKHLARIRRKQSRFVRNTNHCIAKHLVQTALDAKKALALEDLTGIQTQANGSSREIRWLLGNWAFSQLRQFITYKAQMAGISLQLVDPRNTSRTCSRCGYCDKFNRQSQSEFRCLQCGLTLNADYNAALNIEARAARSDSLLCRSDSLSERAQAVLA